MVRAVEPGGAKRSQRELPLVGGWPEGPFWLLMAASGAAPVVVLAQGGSLHAALVALLACLATPGAALEAMLGLARAALAIAPSDR